MNAKTALENPVSARFSMLCLLYFEQVFRGTFRAITPTLSANIDVVRWMTMEFRHLQAVLLDSVSLRSSQLDVSEVIV
jgi:hypothetical protein